MNLPKKPTHTPACAQRRPALHLTAAASLALAAVTLPATAQAGLLWDLRAISISGGGDVVDGKTVKLDASAGPGTTITLQLWVVITGTDGILNEQFQSTVGSIMSSPGTGATADAGVPGNLALSQIPSLGLIKGDLSNALQEVWQTGSYSNGPQADLDGDGDLDLGSSNLASTLNWVTGRASGPQDGSALAPEEFHALGNGGEFLISAVTFALTAVNGEDAIGLNWVAPSFTSSLNQNARALYLSDGAVKSGADANVAVGLPVMVTTVPEPAGAALLLTGLGLLTARRRRRAV